MPTYRCERVKGPDGIEYSSFEKHIRTIAGEVKHGGGLKVLTPVEYITDQQRKWYKGICLSWLMKHDENQESREWWDMEVKKLCNGLGLLKKEIFFLGYGNSVGRLTTKGVGVKNMTQFIEEILAMSVTKNWGIAPPDKELRSK